MASVGTTADSSHPNRLAEINACNAAFYAKLSVHTQRRMSDAGLLRSAFDDLDDETFRLPLYFRKPIEFLLEEAERKRTFFMGLNGRKGGKRKDALQTLIDRIVGRKPDIDGNGLLHGLRNENGNGIVQDVANGEVTFVNSSGKLRSAKISALKHRLSRAKKKLVAKSR
jgi:hypothetical protein